MAERTCSIDGCERVHQARGWCKKHYHRWHTHGDPLVADRLMGATTEERLRSKLAPTVGGCLEFSGYLNPDGYGRFRVGNRMPAAHRVAYELWVGTIPAGLYVLHHCDNPPCCNPEHLFAGTQQDNVDDMFAKGRDNCGHGLARGAEQGERLRSSAASRRRAQAREAGHPEDWKRCSGCDVWKSPEVFGPNAARPDGLQTYCRQCYKTYIAQRKARRHGHRI